MHVPNDSMMGRTPQLEIEPLSSACKTLLSKIESQPRRRGKIPGSQLNARNMGNWTAEARCGETGAFNDAASGLSLRGGKLFLKSIHAKEHP